MIKSNFEEMRTVKRISNQNRRPPFKYSCPEQWFFRHWRSRCLNVRLGDRLDLWPENVCIDQLRGIVWFQARMKTEETSNCCQREWVGGGEKRVGFLEHVWGAGKSTRRRKSYSIINNPVTDRRSGPLPVIGSMQSTPQP